MDRVGRWVAASAAALALVHGPPLRAAPQDQQVRLFADTDDDDGDGAMDRDGTPPRSARDVEWVVAKEQPFVLKSLEGGSVRVIAGKGSFTAGHLPSGLAAKQIGLQGLSPGKTFLDLGARRLELSVCGVEARDADGTVVDLVRSHASISSTLPEELGSSLPQGRDREAVSWSFRCPAGALPRKIRVESLRPGGEPLDVLDDLGLVAEPCGDGAAGLECGHTGPIRAIVDWADRTHPVAIRRSLRAEVGGRLVVQADGRKAASIRVGGPRHTQLGTVERYRARLRFHVLRGAPHGGAAVGGSDAGARDVVRAEVRTASMLWGQCGIHFGPEEEAAIEVVDPPPRYLLAVGCEVGLPASGGTLAFSVDGTKIHVPVRAAESPVSVAHAVTEALEKAGFHAEISPNAPIAQAALRTADVLVRRKSGALADLHALADEPLSTDPTLPACIGDVDFADGLRHFDDLDAAAGTLEERTLVKAYDDGDPGTVDVFVVPSFSKTGRIGESFIDGDGSSIQNVVIVDRIAILSGSRSYALSHELGHVLLDMPGHPDDFGVDRPWVLMDADAADSSVFGPRRLPPEDCERAIRQSGPGASVPLLTPWPLLAAPASRRIVQAGGAPKVGGAAPGAAKVGGVAPRAAKVGGAAP